MIIGNEYAEEVGGGTSQVATTVFNAAWEAGLRITERNPHSLYISRYQLGRDATVYWPSLDLKFVNDTEHWVLVKGFAEGDGISIAIYGGESRRVESSRDAARRHGAGSGRAGRGSRRSRRARRWSRRRASAPTRTSATRKVYAADGELIRSETWTTSYEGETRVVRVGTKVAEPKPKTDGRGRRRATPPRRPRRYAADASAVAIAVGEPRRNAGRPVRLAIDGRVTRVAVGDELAVALDPVLVA